MMRLVRSGIVRTGGCDGCGAIGDTVTASPEEHEDMPEGESEVRWLVWFASYVVLFPSRGKNNKTREPARDERMMCVCVS